MKGIITAAIVFAGLQGVTLGLCAGAPDDEITSRVHAAGERITFPTSLGADVTLAHRPAGVVAGQDTYAADTTPTAATADGHHRQPTRREGGEEVLVGPDSDVDAFAIFALDRTHEARHGRPRRRPASSIIVEPVIADASGESTT